MNHPSSQQPQQHDFSKSCVEEMKDNKMSIPFLSRWHLVQFTVLQVLCNNCFASAWSARTNGVHGTLNTGRTTIQYSTPVDRQTKLRLEFSQKDNELQQFTEGNESCSNTKRLPSDVFPRMTRRSCWTSVARATAGVCGVSCMVGLWSSLPTKAAAVSGEELRASLRPATEDQPRIPFPDGDSLTTSQQDAAVEGLLYLKNPRSERRPTASDVIVLTVRRAQAPDTIIGGAKVPVSKVGSFPIRFRMTARNAVVALSSSSNGSVQAFSSSPRDVWNRATASDDLIIQALVCDRERAFVQDIALTELLESCETAALSQPPVGGEGLAKIVRLQQQTEGGPTTIIRAPASLPLG